MEISEKLQNKKYKADDKNEKMGASCIYKSSPISSSSSCPSIFPSSHHSASLIPPPHHSFPCHGVAKRIMEAYLSKALSKATHERNKKRERGWGEERVQDKTKKVGRTEGVRDCETASERDTFYLICMSH